MVYATRGLVEALLSLAHERAPASVTAPVAVTPAGKLADGDVDLPGRTPVFTHFYLPDAGRSVAAVFGVDLATPPGTEGRFVSHPDGRLELVRTDDLHEVVFVAVPPWDRRSLAAFDRRGRRRTLTLVDAAPPEELL